MSGTATPNLPLSYRVDDLIANRNGNTVRIELARLVALMNTLQGPSYATRAELDADLAWPAGSVGTVFAGNYPGVYQKSGAFGAGSWAKIGDVPISAITAAQLAEKAGVADLAALITEVRYGRVFAAELWDIASVSPPAGADRLLTSIDNSIQYWAAISAPPGGMVTSTEQKDATGQWWKLMFDGRDLAAEVTARINATRDSGLLELTNVALNGSAITADISPGSGVTTLAGSSTVHLISPLLNDGPITLNVAGAGVWPVLRRNGTELVAGDIKAGASYQLRRRGSAWRVNGLLDSDVQALVNVEATARAAGDSKLSLALRDGATIPLTNIAGTGDAITADLQATMIDADITTLSAIAEVEYVPVATNSAANPTITIAGVSYGIRDADGGTWPADGFSTARIYKLRRRGGVLRVVSGALILADMAVETAARVAGDAALQTEMRTRRVASVHSTSFSNVSFPPGTDTVVRRQATGGWGLWVTIAAPTTPDPLTQQQDKDGGWWQRAWLSTDVSAGLTAETTNRIIGDAQMGTATLTAVAGTGDTITAAVPSQLTAIGMSAANLREIMWLPIADNTGAATINVDGMGAVELRGPDNLTLTAGAIKAGRWARAVKNGSRWNYVSPTVRLADLAAEAAARANADATEATVRATADTAEAAARASGDAALAKRLDPAVIARGDGMVLAEINGVPVLGLAGDGTLIARFPDGIGGGGEITIDDVIGLRDALDNGAGGGATPASPDLAGDVDAWEVWQDGDLVYFTARLWGDYPRQYVRRGTGDAWANGPSRARLRLAYGDDLANAATDRGPARFAHVATLGDGEGQDGLNGAVPSQDATDLARAGLGYPGLVGDQWLARRTGSLPLVGARSEAVAGATLAQLRTGQPMLNLKRAVTQFTSVLGPYNRTAQVDAVSILHGAADDSATYADDLLTLTEDVIRETGALSVHVVQPAGTWQRGNWASALGTVQAWRDRGALPLVVVSPLYWTGLRAGTLATPDAVSMTMLAELDAIAGNDWFCPAAFLAARSGATINVDFEVMPGATLTATPEGLAHSATTITGVQVVAHPVSGAMTRLAVTLASAVAGRLTYRRAVGGTDNTRLANYGTAGIADSWSAASVVDGRTLRRPAYAFEMEIA